MKTRNKKDVTGLFEGKHTYAVRYIPPPFSVCTASFRFLHAIRFALLFRFLPASRLCQTINPRTAHREGSAAVCTKGQEENFTEALGFVFGHRQEKPYSFWLRRKRTDTRVCFVLLRCFSFSRQRWPCLGAKMETWGPLPWRKTWKNGSLSLLTTLRWIAGAPLCRPMSSPWIR